MILVDTSVWIDHFRKSDTTLTGLLESERVACHPFVIGELACGTLPKRKDVLSWLGNLFQTPVAEPQEILVMIDALKLSGEGLGYIDMHMIATARLAGIPLWTKDRRLADACGRLGIGWKA